MSLVWEVMPSDEVMAARGWRCSAVAQESPLVHVVGTTEAGKKCFCWTKARQLWTGAWAMSLRPLGARNRKDGCVCGERWVCASYGFMSVSPSQLQVCLSHAKMTYILSLLSRS